MTRRLFDPTLVHANRVRSYQLHLAAAGWEASAREDQSVRAQHHPDWHRVEHTVSRFKREIAELRPGVARRVIGHWCDVLLT